MLIKKTQLTQNCLSSNKSTDSSPNSQHGLLLLHIPPESLTHITSNLDPRSLLAVAQVNSRLADHIKDDHTWHRAFVQQLLGIGPETDLHNAKCLLLRRSHQGSWRQEFILHFSLRRYFIMKTGYFADADIDPDDGNDPATPLRPTSPSIHPSQACTSCRHTA